MLIELKPSALVEELGISASYASQVLSGARRAPWDVSLRVFRVFGVRIGVLAEMSDEDIGRLCAERHGGNGDTCASSIPSAGKSNNATAEQVSA